MILVTGATGLVGSHLLYQLLKEGYEVRALFRKKENINRVKQVFAYFKSPDLFAKINWFQADILDIPLLEEAFDGIDFVYHCAALVSFDPNEEEQLRKVNIEGTANVVNCCLDFKVKKLCYVSSIASLGDLKENETLITEETEWNPEKHRSDYAISKYGAEMEVWRGYQEGLSVVVVNPGVILGPFFWEEGSGDIYQKIKNGIKFYTKGGTGFVSVNDVVGVMIKLMNCFTTGERYIVVSETKNYQEISILIANKLQVKVPKYHAKKWMTSLAWKIDWFLGLFGKKRVLSKDMARTLHTVDYFDTSKIKNTLGYDFEGIENYIKSLN